MRLIDANVVVKGLVEIRDDLKEGFPKRFQQETIRKALRVVEESPTIEAEPVRHGRWIEEKKQTFIPVEFDAAGEPVLHDYVVYRCDQCGRTAGKKEPYCHCSAKMDLKEV